MAWSRVPPLSARRRAALSVARVVRPALCLAMLLVLGTARATAAAPDAAPPPDRVAATALAPGGTLRVAINYGNPVLAQRIPAEGAPHGVSAELARELGRRLGVPVRFVVFDEAGKVSDALASHAWDVAFLAIDPVRAAGIAFTPPYVVIEGSYVVPDGSPLRDVAAVDAPGRSIAVAKGSAYDLYLTRTLRHATLVRLPDSAAAAAAFEARHLDVLASVRQPLAALVASRPGLRLLPGHFMLIEQAMGIPREHAAGLPALTTFVEAMKASGFVAQALAQSGQKGTEVAPPAPAR